jgi:hypothetical protein
MAYLPNEKRYDGAQFNRCGRSGIVLPPISLGLWQNFGGVNVFETGRAVLRRAFDRGVATSISPTTMALPMALPRKTSVKFCARTSAASATSF